MKTATRNKLLDYFEDKLKRDFVDDKQAECISCPIGGLADDPVAGVSDGCISLSREDMLGIFDPVINLIIPLVQDQIDTIEQQDQLGLQVSVCFLFFSGRGRKQYRSNPLTPRPFCSWGVLALRSTSTSGLKAS